MRKARKFDPLRMVFEVMGVGVRLVNHHVQNGKFDPALVEINQFSLNLPRLAPEFAGFRLAHISDIHIGTWMTHSRLVQMVEMVNQLEPDLIAITGDFVTHNPQEYAPDLQAGLSRLRAPEGVYAILGNHDHWTDPVVVRQVLADCGIVELKNAVHTLQRGSAQLHLAGVDDIIEALDDLPAVLDQLPSTGAAILLAHEPDFADCSAASKRFDLQLSGHTHGGQIVVPLIGAPVIPRLGRRYPTGLYRVNGMYQFTNRGLGTAVLQLRLNCPPEIALFTLQPLTS